VEKFVAGFAPLRRVTGIEPLISGKHYEHSHHPEPHPAVAASALHAQAPRLIDYEGRIAAGGVNFEGSGQFKFALVDAAGTTSYWSNDVTTTVGSEPAAAVTLTVTNGRYSVRTLHSTSDQNKYET
jgi:hypothetical protein